MILQNLKTEISPTKNLNEHQAFTSIYLATASIRGTIFRYNDNSITLLTQY